MGDFYAIMTAFCWSAAVILFDISSKRMDSYQLNVLKNFIGILGFIVTILFLKIPYPFFSMNEIFVLVFSGAVGVAIADLLFLDSLRRLGSGLSAVVATIYSPSIFIIAYLLFGEILSFQSLIGGFFVIIGIIVSMYKMPHFISKTNLYLGVLIGICAQILTAYSVLIVKPIMDNSPILYIALFRFGIGLFITSFILFLKSGISGFTKTLREGLSTLSVIMAGILGTYLSVIFWLAGFKYTLAGRAAIYNQLSTILIIIMAVLFLKEKLTYRKSIGVCLSILGAILVSIY